MDDNRLPMQIFCSHLKEGNQKKRDQKKRLKAVLRGVLLSEKEQQSLNQNDQPNLKKKNVEKKDN